MMHLFRYTWGDFRYNIGMCRSDIAVCGLAAILAAPLMINTAQAATKIDDAPIVVTTTIKRANNDPVQPNVAILIDNSGSMKNIMWKVDPNYDPTDPNSTIDSVNYFDYNHTYPSWLSGNGNSQKIKNITDANGMACGNDPSTGVGRCIKLPDPAKTATNESSKGQGETSYLVNYVNFLFQYAKDKGLYDASGNYDYTVVQTQADLIKHNIPQKARMGAARDVIKDLVSDTNYSNIRFGLFKFQSQSKGATLMTECEAPSATVSATQMTTTRTTKINELFGETSTPLAEAYYDMVRYFKGYLPNGNSGNYPSPIQYRCQQNLAIVITDGYPHSDGSLPTNQDSNDTTRLTTDMNYDGLNPASGPLTDAGTSYLDDMAKYGFDTDLRHNSGTPANSDVDFDSPLSQRPAFPVRNGPDLSNNSTYAYSAVPALDGHQYLTAHTIGLATANQMLVDAAYQTRGTYASVDSSAKLRTALDNALSNISISAPIKSVASISIGSGVYVNNQTSYIYAVNYNPSEWKGEITAIPFAVSYDANTKEYTTQIGDQVPGKKVETVTLPSAASRNIKTLDGTTLINFSSANAAKLAAIGNDTTNQPNDTTANRINYLRGDNTWETNNSPNGFYRSRTTVLSDIVNSAPVFVGVPSEQYPDNIEDVDHLYSTFVTANSQRTPMIYVSSNGGGVHGINVDPTSSKAFQETVAFIPPAILDQLGELTKPSYSHQYYADGSATTRDVFYASAWHTALTTGLGKGEQAIVGFDATTPGSISDAWQFSDADDSDMGYQFSRPSIAKMKNGKWAVIFGNGLNSDQTVKNDQPDSNVGPGKAVVFIRYFDGTLSKLDTSLVSIGNNDHAVGNGMTGVTPVDLDGDYLTDFLYATDYQGNIWKFNVTDADPTKWGVAGTTMTRLFTTCDAPPCSQPKPFTTYPSVGPGPLGNTLMVYAGTGQYLNSDDPENTDLQSFYAVMDYPYVASFSVIESDLQAQTITEQSSSLTNVAADNTTTNLDGTYRLISNTAVNYYSGNMKGWKLDLHVDGSTAYDGERVTHPALLRNGKVVFTSNFYKKASTMASKMMATTLCNNVVEGEGGSWIMVLDAINGTSYAFSSFDTTGDNMIDDTDKATIGGNSPVNVTVGGMLVEHANLSTPTIMTNASGQDVLLGSDAGGINAMLASDERENILNGGGSWVQQ